MVEPGSGRIVTTRESVLSMVSTWFRRRPARVVALRE
jgi:hypothetical protein